MCDKIVKNLRNKQKKMVLSSQTSNFLAKLFPPGGKSLSVAVKSNIDFNAMFPQLSFFGSSLAKYVTFLLRWSSAFPKDIIKQTVSWVWEQ